MSHEIHTPMNAIIGLTHLLRRSNPQPPQAERQDKIDSAGRHLLSIIDDILDLSKIEVGQVKLEATDFHLSAILERAGPCHHASNGKPDGRRSGRDKLARVRVRVLVHREGLAGPRCLAIDAGTDGE